MNIYVGNLPRSTSEQELQDQFSSHGEVKAVKLIKDFETGELRGFGFVEMPNDEQAKSAIEALNGSQFGGRKMVVNEAKPKSNDRRGGGGGGGRDSRGGGGGNRGGFRRNG